MCHVVIYNLFTLINNSVGRTNFEEEWLENCKDIEDKIQEGQEFSLLSYTVISYLYDFSQFIYFIMHISWKNFIWIVAAILFLTKILKKFSNILWIWRKNVLLKTNSVLKNAFFFENSVLENSFTVGWP